MQGARIFGVVMLAAGALAGGCAVAQSVPKPPPPVRDVAREEAGVVVNVRDTRLDISTGMGRGMTAQTPAIPVGPVGLRLPVTIGGEKRTEVAAEEITVQLDSGKMIAIVQALSSPPFAPGERVKVLEERRSEVTGESRRQVVRE